MPGGLYDLVEEYFAATPERKKEIEVERRQRFPSVRGWPQFPNMVYSEVADNEWGWAFEGIGSTYMDNDGTIVGGRDDSARAGVPVPDPEGNADGTRRNDAVDRHQQSGEILVPTQGEMNKLPLRAVIAFAARCARRVQPLFRRDWPDAPPQHLQSIERAVTSGERAAFADIESAVEALRAENLDSSIFEIGDAAIPRHDAAAKTAVTVARAVRTASVALGAASSADPAAISLYAAETATASALAAGHARINRSEDMRSAYHLEGPLTAAMRFDYELLLQTSRDEAWTDGTPVPPDFFGPLWPFGTPPDWPRDDAFAESGEPTLRLEFDLPDDMDPDEADRAIGELVRRANELHVSMGGSGLIIRDGKAYESAPVLEPEPQGVC